jgi:hypothetical protein
MQAARCFQPHRFSALPTTVNMTEQADVGVGRGPGGPPHTIRVHSVFRQECLLFGLEGF